MAEAGDCLGYARGVSSARFTRSAVDGQAGWALRSLRSLRRCRAGWAGGGFLMGFRFLRTLKTKKCDGIVARCGPGGQADPDINFRF